MKDAQQIRIRVSRVDGEGGVVDYNIILDDMILRGVLDPQNYVGYRVFDMINRVTSACGESEIQR